MDNKMDCANCIKKNVCKYYDRLKRKYGKIDYDRLIELFSSDIITEYDNLNIDITCNEFIPETKIKTLNNKTTPYYSFGSTTIPCINNEVSVKDDTNI